MEETKEKRKIYNLKNKERFKERRKLYNIQKYNNDPLYQVSIDIRNLIKCSLRDKNYTKKSRTYEILGCSYEEFKEYIEKQFEPWMNYNNHGVYTGNYNETWQYDHIIPISSGMTEDEILKLNHYTNFRPLCSKLNNEKSNKRENPYYN